MSIIIDILAPFYWPWLSLILALALPTLALYMALYGTHPTHPGYTLYTTVPAVSTSWHGACGYEDGVNMAMGL